MKKVLISCSTHDASLYLEALKKLHIQPMLSDKIEDEHLYDGLLLPGGGDISPFFYRRKNRNSTHICLSEDIIQLLMFHRFLEQGKPILGVCKGMQLINVALCGTLIQVLPTEQLHAWHDGDRYHNTNIEKGSILSSLYGTSVITNSAHHQAICTLGTELLATQYASDGVIEGIEHRHLPILGVQWHPERLCNTPLQDTISKRGTQYANSVAYGMPVFEWFAKSL